VFCSVGLTALLSLPQNPHAQDFSIEHQDSLVRCGIYLAGSFTSHATAEITLNNETNHAISVEAKVSDATIFKITPSIKLLPGESHRLKMLFTPQDAGRFPDKLIFSDATGGSIAIPLYAEAYDDGHVSPDLIAPESMIFTKRPLGVPSYQTAWFMYPSSDGGPDQEVSKVVVDSVRIKQTSGNFYLMHVGSDVITGQQGCGIEVAFNPTAQTVDDLDVGYLHVYTTQPDGSHRDMNVRLIANSIDDISLSKLTFEPEVLDLPRTFIGDIVKGSFTVHNPLDHEVTITSVRSEAIDGFDRFLTHFPIKIQPHGETTIEFSYQPSSVCLQHHNIVLICTDDELGFHEWRLHVCIEAREDFREANPQLDMAPVLIKGEAKTGIKVLSIINNTYEPIRISSLDFANQNHFKIQTAFPQLPATLKPFEKVLLTIQYDAGNETDFADKLLVQDGEFILASINFIYGNPVMASVASSAKEDIVVASPNPFSRSMTLIAKNGELQNIEVFNSMGMRIYHTEAHGTWQWNGVSDNSTLVPNGVYYVRSTGSSSNGKVFTSTNRVVLSR